MTDLLRGNSTAATGVYAEHHRLDVVILGELTQVFCCLLSHNVVSAALQSVDGLTVHDAAIGIVDGDLVTVVILL